MNFTPSVFCLLACTLSAVLPTFSVHAATVPLAHPIKLLALNFNSEEVPNDHDSKVRDLRFNAICDWIKKNDPDIVLLQEAWNYHKDPSVGISIGRAMDYDVIYYLGMGFPKILQDSNVILAKKSLHLRDEQDLKLPHSAKSKGDGRTYIIPFGSISWLVSAKLTLPNGEPLYVGTTHLIAPTSDQRADQARAIDQAMRARVSEDGLDWDHANVLINGDFNSHPEGPGPAFMVSQGYQDAFAVNHPGDESCTYCGDPFAAWFNPFTIGAGLLPSQARDAVSVRYDYLFTHGSSVAPLTTTLIFTSPFEGIWMSDHYGMSAQVGNQGSAPITSPVHDTVQTLPDTQIITITDKDFLCRDPWNNSGNGEDANCTNDSGLYRVQGARGVTIINQSSFYFEVAIDGPGDIFTSKNAALKGDEQAAFSFDATGDFSFSIHNLAKSPNIYRAALNGAVRVENTGF